MSVTTGVTKKNYIFDTCSSIDPDRMEFDNDEALRLENEVYDANNNGTL